MRRPVLISVGLALLVVSCILFAQGTREAGTATAVPGVTAARLHIAAVRITNTQCGKPLEFNTIIKNVGSAPFNKQAAVIITVAGNHIAHTFPMSIPAGGSITDKQSTLNQSFLANCCQDVSFVVTMGTSEAGGDVPEWDKVPFKVGTKPGSVVVVNQ